jgi:hypothetical protein
MFVCASAAPLSTVCRGVSTPDPLTQLPCLLYARSAPLQCISEESAPDPLQPCRSCLFLRFLQCTVLQRSQHSDPLAQLPMFVTLLAASFAQCVRESTPDPLAQLPMFVLRSLQRSFLQCIVLQRSVLILLAQPSHVVCNASYSVLRQCDQVAEESAPDPFHNGCPCFGWCASAVLCSVQLWQHS